MRGALQRHPRARVVACLAHIGLLAVCAIAHPQQERPAAPRATVGAPARVTQNERLAILGQERSDLLARLVQATQGTDALAVTRLRDDLAALDREIAAVSRAPAYEIKVSTPARVAKGSAEKTAEESELATSEPTYASWDVFKNFGKGSK